MKAPYMHIQSHIKAYIGEIVQVLIAVILYKKKFNHILS